MELVDFQQWMLRPELLNRETLSELRRLLDKYPYFQSLRLLYLKNLYLLHDERLGEELKKAVVYIADRRKLFQLMEENTFLLSSQKPETNEQPEAQKEELSVDRTLTLIDAFLSTVPEEVTAKTEIDYSIDYTSLLENALATEEPTQEVPKLKGFELIDDFIEKKNDTPRPMKRVWEEETESAVTVSDNTVFNVTEEDDESCFTETLAKIYVKQHRYSKALEIIKKLSLKYPKKNAYFADQIRFLEKLIINANSK